MICEAIVNRAPVAPVRLNPTRKAGLQTIVDFDGFMGEKAVSRSKSQEKSPMSLS